MRVKQALFEDNSYMRRQLNLSEIYYPRQRRPSQDYSLSSRQRGDI